MIHFISVMRELSRTIFPVVFHVILMSLLVKPHRQSFLRKQESRKTKENTGFPLKDCGNDGKSNVLLLIVFLVFIQVNKLYH